MILSAIGTMTDSQILAGVAMAIERRFLQADRLSQPLNG